MALVTGARLARAWGGATIARAAEEALIKIEAMLPDSERHRISGTEIHAPDFMMRDEVRHRFDLLEQSAEKRQILDIEYDDADGASTQRRLRPLGLWFWGKVWMLATWCEMRTDFRTFRLDRMRAISDTGETFKPERGKMLSDYISHDGNPRDATADETVFSEP